MDSAGIDYHVSLMANAFQKCLDVPELQPELLCALVKQTTPHIIPQSKGHLGQSSSGGGVQVKRQHSIKHPRVSRFICFQVSPGNYRSNYFLFQQDEIKLLRSKSHIKNKSLIHYNALRHIQDKCFAELLPLHFACLP